MPSLLCCHGRWFEAGMLLMHLQSTYFISFSSELIRHTPRHNNQTDQKSKYNRAHAWVGVKDVYNSRKARANRSLEISKCPGSTSTCIFEVDSRLHYRIGFYIYDNYFSGPGLVLKKASNI